MIPQFNQSGVLPPFRTGSQPTDRGEVSPYKVTISEFVSKFAFNIERMNILNGYVDYCKKLESIGITEVFNGLMVASLKMLKKEEIVHQMILTWLH